MKSRKQYKNDWNKKNREHIRAYQNARRARNLGDLTVEIPVKLRERKEKPSKIVLPKYRHGLARTRFYHTWKLMKRRCYVPHHLSYARYGARGIHVCERWWSFINFRNDMLAEYRAHEKEHGTKNTTIDRIDSSQGYSPENCRWATWKVQARMHRKSVVT